MIQVNAMGDACPIPVVKTKNAIAQLGGAGVVETLVDNEIAVQNLTKMANQKGYGVTHEQLGERQYKVTMTIGEAAAAADDAPCCVPTAPRGDNTVVVISSSTMGTGDEQLGKTLLKAFLYALSQQDTLPRTILFYNGGAALTCEDSPALEDLRAMAEQGVEILTCGTCLNYYGLTDRLQVGGVSNMYTIVEKMTQADRLVKP